MTPIAGKCLKLSTSLAFYPFGVRKDPKNSLDYAGLGDFAKNLHQWQKAYFPHNVREFSQTPLRCGISPLKIPNLLKNYT